MNKRLLSEIEVKSLMESVYPNKAGKYRPTPFDLALSKAQDAKTLKEVGDAFDGCYEIQKDGAWFWNPQYVRRIIEALKQGKMPE